MHALIVPALNADWEMREVDIPEISSGQVLVKVRACGICGTDVWLTEGKLAFGEPPLSLGHEGVGEVVAVGDGVTTRKVGDRVGIIPLQRGCGRCDWCRRGEPVDFVTAANCAAPVLTGFHHGWRPGRVRSGRGRRYRAAARRAVLRERCADHVHRLHRLVRLRRASPKPGARVAVSGIGGLGHLALQYAKAAGFTTIAITHSPDKHELAHKLGADMVVSNGAELRAAGGADVLLATNSSNEAAIDAMQGLSPRATVVLMGIAFDTFTVTNMAMVMGSLRILGSAHNGTQYLVEAMQLAADGKVTPMIEVFDKNQAADAYTRAAEGKARFRAVISYA
jgi:alcohol dehydrogenase/propanol-preferring alcohol dehydrogenase